MTACWRTVLKSARTLLETEQWAGVQDVAVPRADASHTLELLHASLQDCRTCAIGSQRTTLVFGSGNPRAALMFVGEAPGADEDRQGLPFVGAAGQLLTRMIEAMGLSRDDVYIANILKCRPPDNRYPQPDEIANCIGNLKAQVHAVKPRVICLLGRCASQALLNTTAALGRIRGKFFEWEGIPAVPTFHPAYLLRTPGDKKLAWQDLQTIMGFLAQDT